MKPLIGVTSSEKFFNHKKHSHVNLDNIHAISKAGGIPIILPNSAEKDTISQLGTQLDGLYLTGGEDIDPMIYGEAPILDLGEIQPKRDHFELQITKVMFEKQKPILGVCRGCQIINVALGGTLYQDIYSQKKDEQVIKHQQDAPLWYATHNIKIEWNSLLHRLVNVNELKVNSLHHQAVKQKASNLTVGGVSDDGIIEAIESTNANFILGLQWHPESLLAKNDTISLHIYEGFIKSCKKNIKR